MTGSHPSSIALVGSMGAGKSSIGGRLARRLGLPFRDSDAEVEAEAGLTIGVIFERHGEAAFREIERRVVARLARGAPAVIATGGGAFADAGTRRLLLERCIVAWLDAAPERLAERVAKGPHRPLLGGGDPLPRLRRLAAERAPFYCEAHVRIATDDGRHHAAVERILAALARA